MAKDNTKILIIYTGGTIGMISDPHTGILRPFDFAQIRQQVPELQRLKYTIDSYSFASPVDSSNIHPDTWITLAKLIEKKYSYYDGFVILHGSDTMAYSASMLSFMLENLGKPVIFTGSQLPVGEIRNDARENLITAVEIAASKTNKKPSVPEVCILFDYMLFRGNRATKYSSSTFSAFRSSNYPLLAEAGVAITFNHPAIQKQNVKKLNVRTAIDHNIALLKIFPGMTSEFVKSVLTTKKLKAVVLEAFGSGNAPTNSWFITLLASAARKGIIILDVTQCSEGSVSLGRYETSSRLRDIGVVGGSDMTTEAAITKLMYLIGQGIPVEKIKKLLTVSMRGELTG